MAINDPPTLTDSSKQSLRSYREAADYLVENERRGSSSSEGPSPLEPLERKPSPCGSPPRMRPQSTSSSTATTSTATVTPPSSRCRSRTPSPPHPSPSSREPSGCSSSSSSSKAPRSVSPGGTPASSAGASLRTRQDQGQGGYTPQGEARRRVSWAHALVSAVVTRPRTLRKDVAALFYSRADEKRFRREAESAVDTDWCESLEEDSDSLTSLSDDEGPPEDRARGHMPLWSSDRARKDYGISKAIVVFGECTHTYGGQGVPGSCAIEAAREAEAMASFSFDDAAFWNGQLTWS
eukprot:63403_1